MSKWPKRLLTTLASFQTTLTDAARGVNADVIPSTNVPVVEDAESNDEDEEDDTPPLLPKK